MDHCHEPRVQLYPVCCIGPRLLSPPGPQLGKAPVPAPVGEMGQQAYRRWTPASTVGPVSPHCRCRLSMPIPGALHPPTRLPGPWKDADLGRCPSTSATVVISVTHSLNFCCVWGFPTHTCWCEQWPCWVPVACRSPCPVLRGRCRVSPDSHACCRSGHRPGLGVYP